MEVYMPSVVAGGASATQGPGIKNSGLACCCLCCHVTFYPLFFQGSGVLVICAWSASEASAADTAPRELRQYTH